MSDFCENPMLFKEMYPGHYEPISFNYKPGAERWLKETGQKYVLVPCGHCYFCKQQYQKMWIQRMYAEMKYHKCAWFITLTYAIAPRFINRRDLTLFIKRLRKHYKIKGLKYYAAQEYGSLNKRPHAHLIVFDLPIDDLELLRGDIHTSETIRKIWKHGMVQVDEAEIGSFSYVAGYSAKKTPIQNKRYLEFMKKFPRGLKPYCCMSKGIGKRYFIENYKNIYESDSVIISSHGRTYYQKPCRYFDNLLKSIDLNKYNEIKSKRSDNADFITRDKFKFTDKQISDIYSQVSDIHISKIKRKRFSI